MYRRLHLSRTAWHVSSPSTGGQIRASSRFRPPQQLNASAKPIKASSLPKGSRWRESLKDQIRVANKNHPVILYVSVLLATTSVLSLGHYIYHDYMYVKPRFAAYPEPVERQLRKALTSVHLRPDPEEAEKHFLLALHAADEEGMDPYSPEVMGIRLRLAEMQEFFGRAKAAVQVLDGVVKVCDEKVADLDRGADTQELASAVAKRQGLRRTSVRARVKMANLYESNYLQDPDKAKQILSDAITVLVKETKDAQTGGFSDANDLGLALEEIASMFLTMGDLYATTGEESNAVQTYMLTLQPLRASCNGSKSCREAQVFSNIASTMTLAMKKPGAMVNGKPATPESLSAARRATLNWADQAIATAELVKADSRDEICELASLSAKMTRADLLCEDGRQLQAREAYRELLPALRAANLTQLVSVAEQAMKAAGG